MLAALVQEQAEGEIEHHFGRGWKRCALRVRPSTFNDGAAVVSAHDNHGNRKLYVIIRSK